MRRCKLGFLPHLRHFGNFGRSSVRASCVRSRAASSAVRMGTVIEPRWLNGHLSDVTVLDASWYMPGAQRDPDADFLKARIPGAQRFDIDASGLADTTSPLPRMLPQTPEDFANAVSQMGVCNSSQVVIYSSSGFVGAARAWWMFRVMGMDDANVKVLNGGFARWLHEGFPIATGPPKDEQIPAANFVAKPDLRLVRTMPQMLEQISTQKGVILDARPSGRFFGTSPEPRACLMSGHMPGSISLPSNSCVDAESGNLKTVPELEAVLKDATGMRREDLMKENNISLSCGSGVTAAIVALALHEMDIDAAVYDGSWSEYGSHHSNPVAR